MRAVHSCVGVYSDLQNRLYCIRFNLVRTKKHGYQYEILKATDSQKTITINDGVKTIVGLFRLADKRLDRTAFNVIGNLNDAYADKLLSRRSLDVPLRFRFYDAVGDLSQCLSMISNVAAESRFRGSADISNHLSYLNKLTSKRIKAIAIGEDSPDGPVYALMNSVGLLEANLMKYRSRAA